MRKAILHELFRIFKIYFDIDLAINTSILIHLNYKNKTIANWNTLTLKYTHV